MANLTLEKMAAGGMRDQLGGGFHRYSTDARWQVPHFEKMLYDNALLALDYLEASQATGRTDFARVTRETLDDLVGTFGAASGGFYSATDADSPAPDGRREEGRYFTWTPLEVAQVLGPEAKLADAALGVTPGGQVGGRSVLRVALTAEAVAKQLGLPEASAAGRLEKAKSALSKARAKRPPPRRDEKVLAAWNGLAISALARAGLALPDASYTGRAARAADFVLSHLVRDGRLMRSDGGAHRGYLDDHAFVIAGLLDLYEATGALRWLQQAIALDDTLAQHFEDRAGGGYFQTADDDERLLARVKPAEDGALPTGNSVEALNLLRLYELTGRAPYLARAERTLGAFGGTLAATPVALTEMLLALDWLTVSPKEIVIVTPGPRAQAEPFLARLRGRFLPDQVLVVVPAAEVAAQSKLVPLLEGRVAQHGKVTAYVCKRRVCGLPATDPDAFAAQL